MKKLTSLQKYGGLLREARARGFIFFNNNYLSLEAVQRYINLGRIEYEFDDTGLYLYTDEEGYYQLYMQCGNKEVTLEKREKPTLVRSIYSREKRSGQQEMEKRLQELGFERYARSVQILINPLDDQEEIIKKLNRAERFLERFGLKIIYAQDSQLDEVYSLRDTTSEFKPFHFLYETEEEKKEDFAKGYFRCAVNSEDKICAAQQFQVRANTIYGNWLAVKKEYQEKYGLGTAMAYHSFVYAIEHHIKNYYGWVELENEKSIVYHQSIGYRLTDKISEDWILA